MEKPQIVVANPLLRTPLSLIVDDSCPVINLTHFWIQQRQAWKSRYAPNAPFRAGDGDPAQLHRVPETIPADFAVRWGEWCGAEGIRGKFSLIPFPAGVARVDEGFPGYSRQEFNRWMTAYRETLWPNFDITCEMITHTHVLDLSSWTLTPAWEQYEWADPPLEPLTDYIATALALLREVGIPCEGVTSPGGFGSRQEAAYAQATLDASIRVNNNPRPFYFMRVNVAPDAWPDVPIWHADREKGRGIASIIGCTGDWFGNWTGYDPGDPDRFISEDLQGGCLPPVLEKELPCVLVSHWPGFYFGGQEIGFQVLQEVKRRLDRYDPDGLRTRWMKTSEIGHYWMARQLSQLTVTPREGGGWRLTVDTRFPTADFTLSIDRVLARVRIDGSELRQVFSRQSLAAGTFWVDGPRTVLAFDLREGSTQVDLL